MSKVDLNTAMNLFVKRILQTQNYYSKIATVVSVNGKECEVDFHDGSPNMDVLLQQSDSDLGLLILPTVDSPVVVSFKSTTNAYISMFSDIDSVIFQGGQNEGLIKVIELTDKLNALVSEINELRETFNSHQHKYTAGVSPYALPMQDTTGNSNAPEITEFNKDDYQNELFKH